MKETFRYILNLFRIRREERIMAATAAVLLVLMHIAAISKTFTLFSHAKGTAWNFIIKNFCISGFDPITYSMVSTWDVKYNVYRHPLLSFFVWPLSVLDGWLYDVFGVNLMQVLVAVPLLVCAFYALIFIYRIFRDVIRLGRTASTVLAAMHFSFAYVMVASVAPDHFCVSMFLLIFSIYIAGMKMQAGRKFTVLQTVLLFAVTAGVTLSNGVKTFLYALFTNGRRFFRIKYLLLAVALPSALIWGFARWEYRTFVLPQEVARHEAKAKKADEKRQKMLTAFMDTTSIKDEVEAGKAFDSLVRAKAQAKYKADKKQAWNKHTGKPMGKGEFIKWTDVTTPRLQTAVENFFGESIQMHRDHLLEDTLRSRPVIVKYDFLACYIVEALIMLLFVAGIWCGRRSRFLWMVLSGFAFDLFLHLGLGFGINEVYIMGPHWLFALPIAMAFLIKAVERKRGGRWLTAVVTTLTAWLFVYNATLFVSYFIA